jgi:DNA-binding ferritin-like protein
MFKLDLLLNEYASLKYAELSVTLDMLRALYNLHQTHHWQASGKTFYSDHLLFERLYTTTLKQIDGVAERAVGFGVAPAVDLKASLRNITRFIDAIDLVVDIPEEDIIDENLRALKLSYLAEKFFTKALEDMMKELKAKNLMTFGMEQLLGTILDEHEGLCYLLKQRIRS